MTAAPTAAPQNRANGLAHVGALVRRLAARSVDVAPILQMEALECGPACLAMVLAHYGRFVPLEELRIVCGVSRDGSRAATIVRAARIYGLDAQGIRLQPQQLAQVALPAIAHWNRNHFVVVSRIGRGEVHLMDPASGAVTVSTEQFARQFSGTALTFRSTASFRRGGRPSSLLASLVPRLAGAQAGLLYVIIAGIGLLIPGMVLPTLSHVFIDSIVIREFHDWLGPLLRVMALLVVIQAVLFSLQQHYLLRLETRLALRTSAQFFWHVLRLPYDFFVQRYAGEVATRVAIGDRIARLLSAELATTLLDTVLVAFYLGLMLQYDVVLTAVTATTALVNVIAMRQTAKKRAAASEQVQQERSQLVAITTGGLQSIEMLKASGAESEFFARWAGQLARFINAGQRMGAQAIVLMPLPGFLLAINAAVVLGVGGIRIIDGAMSIGMLLAFQALSMTFLAPVARMMAVGTSLADVKGGLRRLDDVLQAPTDPHAPTSGVASPPDEMQAKLTGRLDLRNITFGFSRLEPPLIENFSLSMEPGKRLALVGKSGSGKSTIAKLVAGLYRPWSGAILFDGQERQDINRELLFNSVAVVDQDVFLFDSSVRENLVLWDTTVLHNDLIAAARDASIHTEIAARTGGFDAHVEEGGRNFSGGQRQRMEIARALVNNPTLLILDEATSALDAATERAIDDNLRRRGCTCLIIAHRLSTIRDCDLILYLERGKVIQSGTHDVLRRQPGPYRELVESETGSDALEQAS